MQRTNKDIILISLLACFWGVQATVILMQVLGFWQAPLLMQDSLLPETLRLMAPKWDLFIYFSFMAMTLIAGEVLNRYYPKSINAWFLVFEGVVSFLMVSALFKMLVYFDSPQLAHISVLVLIAISCMSKIFYPELKKSTEVVYRQLSTINWSLFANAWWVSLIILLIYMPDLQRVLAMIYMGEYFHHLDAFIIASGYASLHGQLPSVGVFSEYGIGLPVIFAKIINALGGFDYATALNVMMGFVIMYFILTYFFMRYWLRSALMAGVAFLLVFRLQMFHYGASPLIWRLPSASPLRFGLDILWMAALLLHLRSGKSRWLMLAAIYSGFALYYMTSTGMCVLATFYAYLLALAVLPEFRRQWWPDRPKRMMYVMSWALPLLSTFAFLGVTIGTAIFQKTFWNNLVAFMLIFSHAGAAPIFESLKYRYFWFFIMSFVVPFTYLATFLYIAYGLYVEKIKKEFLFVALLCIYGLANYQYFVVRSLYTSYYVNALPFVMIACFWFMRGFELLPLVWQKRLKAIAVTLSFYALLTNQNYLAYPNLMNFSSNPMTDNRVIQKFPDRQGFFNGGFKYVKEEDKLPVNDLGTRDEDMRTEDDFKTDADLVAYYQAHFNFPEDVALIRDLTSSSQRVALISSFEVKILIQAKRTPFFYHFPLVESRPMSFRIFPWGLASTPSYLTDTIDELKEGRPLYVFMEKVFLEDNLPSSYQETNAGLLSIIAYVRAHYHVSQEGKYLVAMKRNDSLE